MRPVINILTHAIFVVVLTVALINFIAAMACTAAHCLQIMYAPRGSVVNVNIPVLLSQQRFISVHVATHNELPEVVIQTLSGLSKLDFDSFDFIVIDNNTQHPDVWMPVEAACRRLGERFRFYHEQGMVGAKTGALNFALDRTNAR